MFTGIITDIGSVLATENRGDLRARIGCHYDTVDMAIGASIACAGVCLTVVDKGRSSEFGNWFDVDVSAETLSKTNLAKTNHSGWREGSRVNLERALRLGDELGGHIVSGHIDGVATIIDIRPEGDSTRLVFDAPAHLSRFIASKGSVALNGTSLTVNEVDGTQFGINLIPHTLAHTTWGDAAENDAVNLEIDTLARYVARLSDAGV